MERILSHAGSRTNSVFEIEWKSGDITWLPYYQITHLQALTDYLDLYGESKISKLPKGTGKPPQDDPQIFLGIVSFSSPPIPISTTSTFSLFKNRLKSAAQNIITLVSSPFRRSFKLTSPTVDFEFPMHSHLKCVRHPSFTRLSHTTYLMKDDEHDLTYHTGQIANFLHFDEQLRASKDPSKLSSMPAGYIGFSFAWNAGAAPGDHRRMSVIYLGDYPEDNYIVPTTRPLTVGDFFITAAQAGIAPDAIDQPSAAVQNDIVNEYAALMAANQKKQRKAFEKGTQKDAKPSIIIPRLFCPNTPTSSDKFAVIIPRKIRFPSGLPLPLRATPPKVIGPPLPRLLLKSRKTTLLTSRNPLPSLWKKFIINYWVSFTNDSSSDPEGGCNGQHPLTTNSQYHLSWLLLYS